MPFLAIPFPAIDPIAIHLGPVPLRWYGLAYLAGLLLGWWYARRLVNQPVLWGNLKRPTYEDLDDLLVYVALGIVIGGRLGEVIFWRLPYYLANPLEILKIWEGGMAFHGGFIGAAVAGFLFAWRKKLLPLSVCDLMAVVVPIGLFFGRIANFINAELWGRVTDVPWAVIFPDAGPEGRHPSQLYEAALEGAVLFLIMAIAVRRFGFTRPGLQSGIFCIGYGVARFSVEFFREPDIGFVLGEWLTMGMALCIPLIALGLGLVTLARPRVETTTA